MDFLFGNKKKASSSSSTKTKKNEKPRDIYTIKKQMPREIITKDVDGNTIISIASDKAPDNEGGKYHVSEVFKF